MMQREAGEEEENFQAICTPWALSDPGRPRCKPPRTDNVQLRDVTYS